MRKGVTEVQKRSWCEIITCCNTNCMTVTITMKCAYYVCNKNKIKVI